jgi:threonine dehydrogenase-like Zn-dependent dehydrogenase
VVIVGIYREASPAPWARLQAHEKEIIGSSAYTDEFPTALQLLASGAVRGALLITDRIRLAELEARGLRPLIEEPAKHLKILVQP